MPFTLPHDLVPLSQILQVSESARVSQPNLPACAADDVPLFGTMYGKGQRLDGRFGALKQVSLGRETCFLSSMLQTKYKSPFRVLVNFWYALPAIGCLVEDALRLA